MALVPAASLVAEIGVSGETVAAAKLAAFGGQVDAVATKQVAGASKIGGAFSSLDQKLAGFGLPFTGALSAVGSKLDETGTKATSFGGSLASIGKVELLGAGAGLAVVGTSALKMADNFDQAHARLATTVANVGESMSAEGSAISATDDKLTNLGFKSTDTESALATLTGATHNAGTAMGLMGLAADIARGRHTDLATATGLLVKVETGHVALLGKLGINIKDAAGHTIDATTAVQRLTDLYGGQASAYLDTYAGKTAVLGAKADDVAVSLGETEKQAIGHLADATYTGITAFQSFNATLDGVPGKLLAVGAAVPAVVYAGTKLWDMGGKVVDTFSSIGTGIGNAAHGFGAFIDGSAAARAATIANTAAMAAAETAETGVAEGSAQAKVVALARVDIAQGTLDVATANAGVTQSAYFAATAEESTASSAEIVASYQAQVAAIAEVEAARAQLAATAAVAPAAEGAAVAGGVGMSAADVAAPASAAVGMGALATSATTAGLAVVVLGNAFENARLDQRTSQTGGLAGAVETLGTDILRAIPGGEVLSGVLGLIGGGSSHAKDATSSLTDAEKAYNAELNLAHPNQQKLATDRQKVVDLSTAQTKIQNQLNSATAQGALAANGASTATAAQTAAAKELATVTTDQATALSEAHDKSVLASGAVSDLNLKFLDGTISAGQLEGGVFKLGVTAKGSAGDVTTLTGEIDSFAKSAVSALPTAGKAVDTFNSGVQTAFSALVSATQAGGNSVTSTQAAVTAAQDNLAKAQQSAGAAATKTDQGAQAVVDKAKQNLQSLQSTGTATAVQIQSASNVVAAAQSKLNAALAGGGSAGASSVKSAQANLDKANAALVAAQSKGGADVKKAQDALQAAVNPQGFIDDLTKQAAAIGSFEHNISTLVSEGLGNLAGVLESKGADAGGALAQAFVNDRTKAGMADNAVRGVTMATAAANAYAHGPASVAMGAAGQVLADKANAAYAASFSLAHPTEAQIWLAAAKIQAGTPTVVGAVSTTATSASVEWNRRFQLANGTKAETTATTAAVKAASPQVVAAVSTTASSASEEWRRRFLLANATTGETGAAATAVTTGAPAVKTAAGSAASGATDEYGNKLDLGGKTADALTASQSAWNGQVTVDTANSARRAGIEVGFQFDKGIGQAISDPASAATIYNDALGLGLIAKAGANKALGIASPSTVGIEIGTNYVDAIASTIAGGSAKVESASARLAGSAVVPLPTLAGSALASSSTATTPSRLAAPTLFNEALSTRPPDVLHNAQTQTSSGGDAALLAAVLGLRGDIHALSTTLANQQPSSAVHNAVHMENHFDNSAPAMADLDAISRETAWRVGLLAGR